MFCADQIGIGQERPSDQESVLVGGIAMHRSELEEMADCVDCGFPVDVDRERGYRSSGDWVLCQSCAFARGARFDQEEDRWTVPPDSTGLPETEAHQIR